VPLSIIALPAASFMKSTFGRLPSAWRGPNAGEVVSMVWPVPDTLGSVMLRKSLAAGVIFKSQALNWVSTPFMLVFLLGKPMLFRMMWTLVPVRVTPSVLLPAESQVLASMLYWVPFWNDVLLYQVFPPAEWLA
jgi:hypothetical protein